MKNKYHSEQLMVIHDTARALHRIGAISDAEMKEYDEECLVPEHRGPNKQGTRQNLVHATLQKA
jgi:DNA-binding transcriptional regulator YiaG